MIDLDRANSANTFDDLMPVWQQINDQFRSVPALSVNTVTTPGGTKVLFYSAYQNNPIIAYVMATELRPTLKQWNGVSWDSVSSNISGYALETYTDPFRASNANAGVLNHMDDLAIDTAAGTVTIQAPGANPGTRFRVTNLGTTNSVTVSMTGTDALYVAGHGTVSPGQTATFVCRASGFWNRLA